MRSQLLATVSVFALVDAASAADMAAMPVKAPPAVVQVLSWTGPYIGINGGAVWHRTTSSYELIGGGILSDSARTTSTGPTFGGQLGYNWQRQNWVIGVEVDANWVDASKTVTGPAGVVFHNKLSWLATARARLGVTLAPPTLVYATGGLAVGKVKNVADGSGLNSPILEHSKTKVGWTAGGGIEHMFSRNWTGKIEALYVDLGKDTVSVPVPPDSTYVGHFKNTAVIARAGLNLKW